MKGGKTPRLCLAHIRALSKRGPPSLSRDPSGHRSKNKRRGRSAALWAKETDEQATPQTEPGVALQRSGSPQSCRTPCIAAGFRTGAARVLPRGCLGCSRGAASGDSEASGTTMLVSGVTVQRSAYPQPGIPAPSSLQYPHAPVYPSPRPGRALTWRRRVSAGLLHPRRSVF